MATVTDLWIFGYGSLIWRVDFKFEQKCLGFIKGFNRLFYQKSTRFRGTPENPGRVVTLVPSKVSDARVFGVAFKIPAVEVNSVLGNLDQRESRYKRHQVKFYPYPYRDETPIDILIYVATPENPNYAMNNNEITEIAEQIFRASGEGGKNKCYVYKLADFMRDSFPNEKDDHLFELERILRRMEEGFS